jgi:hypothetical protein
MRGVLVVHGLWLCACGRVSFEDQPEPPASVPEVPVYGAPRPIIELNVAGYRDDDPTATGDLLELYFNSNRPGGPGLQDIYVSRRARTTDPWGPPALVPELSTADDESNPDVSFDGLTLYFDRTLANTTTDVDIYVSTRASRGAPWSPPALVPELNSVLADWSASPSLDGAEVMVSSNRGGSDGVFLTTLDPDAQRFTPMTWMIDGTDAYLAPDGCHLFFHDGDLWVATRAGPGQPFGAPEPLAELDSSANDTDAWASADLWVFMFASERTGDSDLYEALAE